MLVVYCFVINWQCESKPWLEQDATTVGITFFKKIVARNNLCVAWLRSSFPTAPCTLDTKACMLLTRHWTTSRWDASAAIANCVRVVCVSRMLCAETPVADTDQSGCVKILKRLASFWPQSGRQNPPFSKSFIYTKCVRMRTPALAEYTPTPKQF